MSGRTGGPHKRLAEASACSVCGIEFHPWPGNSGRFCSQSCARKGKWPSAWERIVAGLSTTNPDKCWLWTGRLGRTGYAKIRANGRKTLVHVVSYERVHGPVPEGEELDHLCRVRHCANPAHLEPVTHFVNIMRGDGVCSRNARKTHCPKGHEYTEDNIHRTPTGGRRCKQCERDRNSRRSAAAREARNAAA